MSDSKPITRTEARKLAYKTLADAVTARREAAEQEALHSGMAMLNAGLRDCHDPSDGPCMVCGRYRPRSRVVLVGDQAKCFDCYWGRVDYGPTDDWAMDSNTPDTL